MTLTESAAGAVLPWNSLDAVGETIYTLPQQNIDICLMCKYSSAHCENCGDWNTRKVGRPRKEIDTELLKEMLKLRRCNKEICAALGVNERTLQRIKKALT